MLAFPGMLVKAAEEAGIKVPEDPNNFDPSEYKYFNVFCNAQLGSPCPYPGCHFDNAKIIAAIPLDDIGLVTMADLISKGFHIST